METRREVSTVAMVLSVLWLAALVLGLVAALDWLLYEGRRSALVMVGCLLFNAAVATYAVVRAIRRGG